MTYKKLGLHFMYVVALAGMFIVTHYQQKAIDSLINAGKEHLEYDMMVQAMLMDHERRIREFETKSIPAYNKLSCQMDIITAATRSSWAHAYKLLRTGALETCNG